jgi:two-component system NarL family sensor kinase
MSRTGRLLVVAAAWAIPVAWIAVALLSGPSDGTAVSSVGVTEGQGWGRTVTVVETYGDTPLREGDTILLVDRRPVGEWLADDDAPGTWSEGAVPVYEIQRRGAGLNQILQVEVPLGRYPLSDALADNVSALSLGFLLLAGASFAFWRRPRDVAGRCFLAAAALLPAVLTSSPLGLGAADLAGSRGIWPQLVGEAAFAAGLGAVLLAGLALGAPAGWFRQRPWVVPAAFAVPFVGYAVWYAAQVNRLDTPPERLEATASLAVPAAVVTVPALLALLLLVHARWERPDDRVAARLVLLAVAGALAVRLLLVDVPSTIEDDPLVPWGILGPPLVAAVVAAWVVALLRYRLDDIEPVVRRALVQALVAIVVGSVFVAVAGAVNQASEASFEAMLAGGVVALLLLPVAVGLQRTVRRLVYGDRAFPGRVVSELRQLDPLTAPADALEETLRLLSRRLRLSYASIEVYGEADRDPIEAAIGRRRGRPTTIDLVAGGSTLGRMELEVAAGRDPFGPSDRRLLADVGSQVGALVQAVSINRELQSSRQRLVTAREEERRRVRRDLHDGLGPALATLAMGLDSARDLLDEDPARAAVLLGQLSDQTRDEIAEVRRLVDGLRPPVLDQLGLVSALRQRAEEHNVAVRSGTRGGLIWSVDAAEDLEPLPAAVEVAAYRIVVEAVANAVRHSSAEACAVSLRRDPHALRIEVLDTGVGLPPDPVPGVGLGSIRERAEELGGTCSITSGRGSGTVVSVRLPLDESTQGSTR